MRAGNLNSSKLQVEEGIIYEIMTHRRQQESATEGSGNAYCTREAAE